MPRLSLNLQLHSRSHLSPPMNSALRWIHNTPSHPVTKQRAPWSKALVENPTVAQSVKKFSRLLWNSKIHYSVNKSPPLVPILSQLIHSTPTNSVFKINVNVLQLLPPSCKRSVLSDFPSERYHHHHHHHHINCGSRCFLWSRSLLLRTVKIHYQHQDIPAAGP